MCSERATAESSLGTTSQPLSETKHNHSQKHSTITLRSTAQSSSEAQQKPLSEKQYTESQQRSKICVHRTTCALRCSSMRRVSKVAALIIVVGGGAQELLSLNCERMTEAPRTLRSATPTSRCLFSVTAQRYESGLRREAPARGGARGHGQGDCTARWKIWKKGACEDAVRERVREQGRNGHDLVPVPGVDATSVLPVLGVCMLPEPGTPEPGIDLLAEPGARLAEPGTECFAPERCADPGTENVCCFAPNGAEPGTELVFLVPDPGRPEPPDIAPDPGGPEPGPEPVTPDPGGPEPCQLPGLLFTEYIVSRASEAFSSCRSLCGSGFNTWALPIAHTSHCTRSRTQHAARRVGTASIQLNPHHPYTTNCCQRTLSAPPCVECAL